MPPAYDEEEGMGPLEKGRHRYQKKNYQGALAAFAEVGLVGTCQSSRTISVLVTDFISQAVKISTGYLLLTALDHRSATYEKLGQLQLALKDAKEMLELEPELSKASTSYLGNRCVKSTDWISRDISDAGKFYNSKESVNWPWKSTSVASERSKSTLTKIG